MTSFQQTLLLLRAGSLALLVLIGLADRAMAQQPRDGEALYRSLCATCHGTDLRGGRGPDLLDDVWRYGHTRDDLIQVVRDGVPARGMPAFSASLSEQQIERIADHITTAQADASSAPVADSGTALETAVDTLGTLDYAVDVEVFADSLEIPWAIDFLDAQTALITERTGRLRMVRNGRLLPEPVAGTPEIHVSDHAWNQGGLLDVTVDRGHETNGWVYLSYSHPQPNVAEEDTIPSMTRIVRGRIRDNRWVDEQVLFEASHEAYSTTSWHYGSRIVFDPDGYLYFSVGDRGASEQAQDLSRPNGKIHRIHPDGAIPEDNPFVGREEALPSIFTYGHRNPQGLAVHPVTGEIWSAEHGPRGGDELNRLIAGRNYGWPAISHGIDYDGTLITPHRRRMGMEQPTRYWRPSIAVSGLAFYGGELFPYWRDKLLVGALGYEEVRLLDIEGARVMHEEMLLKNRGRVREAVVGPDGAVYVVLNEPGRVLRLTPRAERLQ